MVMILKLDLHTEGLVLFSLYTQYTQWKSTALESVQKAFSRQWDRDVLASQLWARAQAVKETGAIGTWCTVTPRALL